MAKMETVLNICRRCAYRIKTQLGFKDVMPPVLWGPPKLRCYPSTDLWLSFADDDRRKLALIISETEYVSRCFKFFPSRLIDTDWKILFRCDLRKERLAYLKFRGKKEVLKRKDEKQLQMKKEKKSEIIRYDEYNENRYYFATSIKLARDEKRVKSLHSFHQMVLEPFPALVIDCRFFGQLSSRAFSLTVLQIQYLVGENSKRKYPWPIHLCNVNFSDELITKMLDRYKLLENLRSQLILSTTSSNYIDVFPRSRIIYLSPHAEEEIDFISGNEVFIIGAIVDRVKERNIHPHASLIAAQTDGVIAKKLPLDGHVSIRAGTPYLTLTSVSSILYEAFLSANDWESAIQRNIPIRKIKTRKERNLGTFKDVHNRYRQYDNAVLNEVEKKFGWSDIKSHCSHE